MQWKPQMSAPLAERMEETWIETREREEKPRISRRRQWAVRMIGRSMKMSGVYNRGYTNFRNLSLYEETWILPSLPLPQYKLLHLSDLHLDLDPSYLPLIRQRIEEAEADLVVVTGDFADRMNRTEETVTQLAKSLLADLTTPLFASPGNHDTFALLKKLEAAGIPILINESRYLETLSGVLQLSAVDDAHAYTGWKFPAIKGDASILLCHTPALAPLAAQHGFDFMLSGHTHGGQICLPGGWGLYHSTRLPRDLIVGRWRRGNLQGYTSRGTGGCQLPIRYNCPPEITLHVLQWEARKAPSQIDETRDR